MGIQPLHQCLQLLHGILCSPDAAQHSYPLYACNWQQASSSRKDVGCKDLQVLPLLFSLD